MSLAAVQIDPWLLIVVIVLALIGAVLLASGGRR